LGAPGFVAEKEDRRAYGGGDGEARGERLIELRRVRAERLDEARGSADTCRNQRERGAELGGDLAEVVVLDLRMTDASPELGEEGVERLGRGHRCGERSLQLVRDAG